MNTGNSSAAESPFGGIKESGYGKESGKDVAIQEYMVSSVGVSELTMFADNLLPDHQDRNAHAQRSLLNVCVKLKLYRMEEDRRYRRGSTRCLERTSQAIAPE